MGITSTTSIAFALALAGAAAIGCGASAHPDDPKPRRSSHSSLESAGPAIPALTGEGVELRVLSFNVNFGVGHDPINPAVVAETDADLVLLQETTEASEQAFRDALSDRYPHMLFRACCNAGGLGVLSKHPITQQQYIEPTVGWFPAWRVVVDTPLGSVQALNVHLRPPMSDGGSWVAGYFSTRDVRRDEIADFWGHMDPALPTVVAGDFNEDERGRAIEFLAQMGLRSALPQIEPRAKTWHWKTRVGTLHGMLDHVVYGGGLELREASVIEQGNSDHRPVLAVLGMNADP